jgi:hypothetical protein
MTAIPHWADVLTLRDEVRATDGAVGELQMSLAKAVYQTVPVPYADCGYYTDITQPTPKLVGFLARVARRLGSPGVDAHACFHLDQGMGGGKSHALVGIWHMITARQQFFASDLGAAVHAAASAGGHPIDLSTVVPVVLTCDGFSPGKTDPRFGPATDLFGRFLWLLFAAHPDRMGRYQHYQGRGPNKATLQAAFAEVDRPVLVLIDELMDYVMALTDQSQIGGMPGEQAFLNALTDAVDDQPNVALVLVMIKSEEDQAGYHPQAEALRDYLNPRLQRNGETVTVTEPADFAHIIRRRLFQRADTAGPAQLAGQALAAAAAEPPWAPQVYDLLGAGRGPAGLPERVADTYPFHPDLFALVSKEWTVVQAFQRVRSTVSIFARTALHWVNQHQAGQWVPDLIGVGDIPLQTDALEALLSSGVLAGNARAVQGYRAVATTDVINTGGGGGTAFALDERIAGAGVDAAQSHPAVRMATACLAYILVPRPRGFRGATKAELLAALHGPQVAYSAAEEVFNALVAGPGEGGLGALERARPATGKGPERFYLSIKQTLTMYHSNAVAMVSSDDALERLWTRAQQLANKGTFTSLHLIPRESGDSRHEFHGIDSQQNRLVVLDPRRWTLLNGRDSETRAELDVAFGVAPGLTSTFSASMVVAVATTQRRERARAFARELLAWELVLMQLAAEDEEHAEAVLRRAEASIKLDDAIRRAYQHYAFLLRTGSGPAVQYKTLPERQTSLSGANVWAALIADNRAVASGNLSADYVAQLIQGGAFGRNLTPKEIFEQPYCNPVWPLIATDADLRHALYSLATSQQWMLVDSDGSEIRPAGPDQIAPASLQQTLRPRPVPKEQPRGDDSGAEEGPEDRPQVPGGDGTTQQAVAYELTTVDLPFTSITDQGKREQVWQLVRELASLLDPAKASTTDVQMLGVTVKVNARTGDAAGLAAKAQHLPAGRVRQEPDET